jgi:hypothetical protein
MKCHLRSIVVVSAAIVVGALLLRRKRSVVIKSRTSVNQDVDDFTTIQEAVLQRVREIHAEDRTE